jgi:hypothetical protein
MQDFDDAGEFPLFAFRQMIKAGFHPLGSPNRFKMSFVATRWADGKCVAIMLQRNSKINLVRARLLMRYGLMFSRIRFGAIGATRTRTIP